LQTLYFSYGINLKSNSYELSVHLAKKHR